MRVQIIVLILWICFGTGVLAQNKKMCANLEHHLYAALDSSIKVTDSRFSKILILKVIELRNKKGEFSITNIYDFYEHWSAKPSHYIEYKGYLVLFRTGRYDSIFGNCTNFPRYDIQAKKVIRRYSIENITAQTPPYNIYRFRGKKVDFRKKIYKLDDKYYYYNE